MRIMGPTAALAGVPAGIQAAGPWSGRRQLFVRFAAEAETATMYTADALAGELARLAARVPVHSIAIGGRDPLGNAEFLQALLEKGPLPRPALLDCDGQRPDALAPLVPHLALVQVQCDAIAQDAIAERRVESLAVAAKANVAHALVLTVADATDGQVLRMIERVRAGAPQATVVLHPPPGAPVDKDRRWISLMEQAASVHEDVRFALRLPAPTGMR